MAKQSNATKDGGSASNAGNVVHNPAGGVIGGAASGAAGGSGPGNVATIPAGATDAGNGSDGRTDGPSMALALRQRPGMLANIPRVERLENYAISLLGESQEEFATALADNLAGNTLRAFDFPRIRVPTGGGTQWEIYDPATGESNYTKEVSGIIVVWQDRKAYWAKELSDPNAKKGPPQCYSDDCIQGHGDPGVLCGKCPFNQFGTARGGKGAGKACKDVRMLFMLRESDLLPVVISAPSMSLGNVKQYFIGLTSSATSYWACVTALSLEKRQNAQTQDVAVIRPRPVSVLSGPARAIAQTYSKQLRSLLGSVAIPVAAEDVGGYSGGPSNDDTPAAAGVSSMDDPSANRATDFAIPPAN